MSAPLRDLPAALRRAGVAESAIPRVLSRSALVKGPEGGSGAIRAQRAVSAQRRALQPTAPLVLTLPWAVLVPDNARIGVLGGRALLTRRYRTAKVEAAATLRRHAGALGYALPLAGPVRLDVALWLPDRRRRDTANLFKLIGDALEAAAVVTDDAQLADVRSWRAGIDRETPRAVLTLTPAEV